MLLEEPIGSKVQRQTVKTINPYPIHLSTESEGEFDWFILGEAHGNTVIASTYQLHQTRVGYIKKEVIFDLVFCGKALDLGFKAVALHVENNESVVKIGEKFIEGIAGQQRIVNTPQSSVIVPNVDLDASVMRDRPELVKCINPVFNQ